MANPQAQDTFITAMTFKTHPEGLVELHNRNVSGLARQVVVLLTGSLRNVAKRFRFSITLAEGVRQ